MGEAPGSSATRVKTAVSDAMNTILAEVESGFSRGFAGVQLIGNISDICRNGKERARAALEHAGCVLPPQKILINLAPADVRMDGNHLDLPLAISLAQLLQQGTPPAIDLSRWLFVGELGLYGEIKAVRGVVSFAIAAAHAGLEGIVVPEGNLREISALRNVRLQNFEALQIRAFGNLGGVLDWLRAPSALGQADLCSPALGGRLADAEASTGPDFDDMYLTPTVERAALAAATGLHSMLLRGTPGSGKSMLAARLPAIMPTMEREAHIEAMRIHSSHAERLDAGLLAGRPAWRAPHHQASAGALLGTSESPGELSLAHGGVLFLDEFPEFRRDLLESLREPLETGEVSVSRTRRKVVWKSRILLLGACNNCPCGWFGSRRRRCGCGSSKLAAYRQKLSGPILDRIDIHLNMPELPGAAASMFLRLHKGGGKTTARLSQRVAAARAFAAERNARLGVAVNRDLPADRLIAASHMEPDEFGALVNGVIPGSTSNRSTIRALRVARTLADLDGSLRVRAEDLEQAWVWQAEKAAEERGELLLQ